MSEKGGRWCDRWWKYNEKNIDLQNQTNESRPSSASAIKQSFPENLVQETHIVI